MKRPYFPGDFKRMARAALSRNLPAAAMVYFLAALPGLLSSAFASVQSLPLNELLGNYMTKFYTGEAFSTDMLMADLRALRSTMLVAAWVLQLAASLLTPALTLGAIAALLTLLRGGEISYGDVFCRVGCFLKGILLAVMVALKTALWMLPGIAVSAVAIVLITLTDSVGLAMGLSMLGSALMLALGLRAVMHYAMAEFALADNPSLGVMGAIRESVSLMRYRKMQLVMLYVSFIGWVFLSNLVCSMFLRAGAVYYVVNIVLSLAINIYMLTSQCAFYHVYSGHPSQRQETVLLDMPSPDGPMQ